MIQFNIKRFGRLACWSLTNDKRYFVKSFLQIFVILLLAFLFLTMMHKVNDSYSQNYKLCSIIVVLTFAVTVVMGSSYMFYSMENQHDMQNLLMLPASNFEKYLIRYATWIFLLPLYLVAFLFADLFQYFLHWALGFEHWTFVCTTLVDMVRELWRQMPVDAQHAAVNSVALVVIWFHSVFALGANFFRARKHNWALTSIVIVLLTVLMMWIFPFEEHTSYKDTTTTDIIVTDVTTGMWALLNFWLSYKLFCRRQVIGKFINI